MKRAVLCVVLLFFVLCANALALSWDEALSIAEQNSNELASAQKELESSEWTYRKAYSAFLPQLSASASLTDTQSTTSSAWSKSYSYGLSATQYLFKGMEGIYGIQSAYSNLEYQKASLQATQSSVYYDLRSAFISVLIAQENIELLEKILKQRKENALLIQLRYDSGKEDKGNLMRTQADEAQAEYDLSSTKRDLKLAKLKLSQLLQSDVDSVSEQDNLQTPEAVELDQIVARTPTYIMAKRQLESAELAQKASISGFLPSLSLSGNYRKTGSEWPPQTSSKSWKLSLSYSFFPGGSNVADRAIYGARLAQAKEDFADSVKELRYNLEETYENLNDALEGLEVSWISLAASEERAKIVRVKYLNGLTLYDEWDRIESAYIQARKSLLTKRKTALLSEALWHKTYGGYIK